MEKIEVINRHYYNCDCLQLFEKLQQNSFDLIIADINFDTQNKSNPRAKEFTDHFTEDQTKRFFRSLIKLLSDEGTLIAFGEGLISYKIISILEKYYQYSLVWKQGNKVLRHLDANIRPLKNHTDILIFQKYHKNKEGKNVLGKHIYNPQMSEGVMRYASIKADGSKKKQDKTYGEQKNIQQEDTTLRYPKSVLDFQPVLKPEIPLQKPQDLIDFLVLTYSNPGSKVLDPCMGLGSSSIACKKYGRKFLGIEINPKIYKLAKEKITNIPVIKTLKF